MPPDKVKQLEEWEKLNKKRAPKLAKRPKLTDLHKGLLDSFLEVSRRRQYGMAELPLTIEAIVLFAQIFGYDDDLRYYFRLIAAMDDAFLEFQGKRRKSEQESGKRDRQDGQSSRGKK